MTINSNINILGGLPDFNLIKHFLLEEESSHHNEYTAIRTKKAVQRFKEAILETFRMDNESVNQLVVEYLKNEKANQLGYLWFLLMSKTNELFAYLNDQVYFNVYYSGRKVLDKKEVLMCLKDLQKREEKLKEWSEITLDTTASKYLTLLRKFGIAEGKIKKKVIYQNPTFNDFVLYNYLAYQFDNHSNKIESSYLNYSFYEKEFFIEKILDKRLMPYLNVSYSGDMLQIEPKLDYKNLYYELNS